MIAVEQGNTVEEAKSVAAPMEDVKVSGDVEEKAAMASRRVTPAIPVDFAGVFKSNEDEDVIEMKKARHEVQHVAHLMQRSHQDHAENIYPTVVPNEKNMATQKEELIDICSVLASSCVSTLTKKMDRKDQCAMPSIKKVSVETRGSVQVTTMPITSGDVQEGVESQILRQMERIA
jgi:hypothetical protein